MAMEEDQSDWLPKPPPPRPARRDAAIDAALRKFDGLEEAAPAVRERPRPSWFGRPQFAALVSAMLIVVIGVPAALIGLRNQPPSTDERAAPPPLVRCEPSPPSGPSQPEQMAEAPLAPPSPAEPPSARSEQRAEVSAALKSEPATAAPPAIAAPPAAASAPVPMMAAAPPPPPPPPPPAAVARAEKVEEAVPGQDIVVTGARAAQPGASADSSYGPAAPMRAYRAFLSRLQAAVWADDRRAVTRLIAFPLRVNAPGGPRFYRDRRSVERDFDRIFTPEVRRAILSQRADQLFVRDQGAMVGNGEVWFDQTCATRDCSPPGPVRIRAVNP